VLQAGADSFPLPENRPDGRIPVECHWPRLHLPLQLRARCAPSRDDAHGPVLPVTCGDEEIVCDTAEVELCPIDEWQWDPKDDSRWLGAFVLPRDPAVLAIVDVAQNNCRRCRTDSSAGFDGYQSVDDEWKNPAIGIEMQVRALWSALAFEMTLPRQSAAGVSGNRSTALAIGSRAGQTRNLHRSALMLAACLEYIDIYRDIRAQPCLPGFWRSEEAYERFVGMKDAPWKTRSNGAQATPRNSRPTRTFLRTCAPRPRPVETVSAHGAACLFQGGYRRKAMEKPEGPGEFRGDSSTSPPPPTGAGSRPCR